MAPGGHTSKAQAQAVKACSTLLRKGEAGTGNADDVLQEACLRVLELKDPHAIRDPARYAGRIIRNLFVDGLRRKKRAKAVFVDSVPTVEVPDDQPNAERVLAGKEILGQVMAEIDRLPLRCRQAFILHRFENLTYPAIARTMGVSIGTVEKHIAEAMARLARALDAG
jgi:RNA polymerase sigma factor (sigma-70 family)